MAPRKPHRPVAGRKPRPVPAEWLPVTEIQGWFEDAFGKDKAAKLRLWFEQPLSEKDPRTALDKLRRDIQVATNQYWNAQLKRNYAPNLAPLTEMKDAEPAERQNKLLEEVYNDANSVRAGLRKLEASLCKLEEFGGSGRYPGWKISLSNLQAALGQIGAKLQSAMGQIGVVPALPSAIEGRPPEAWHELARKIAGLIKSALPADYQGAVTATNPESVVAKVGARVLTKVLGREISPEGFAAACRIRDRYVDKTNPIIEELETLAKRLKHL